MLSPAGLRLLQQIRKPCRDSREKEEINRNITDVYTEANKAHDASVQSQDNSETLSRLSGDLTSLVGRFRT